MKNSYFNFFVICLLVMSLQMTSARDKKVITHLSGKWKFNLGDDMKWADPKFDDRDWDMINVPNPWEKEGYVNYDGFAWYRKRVVLPHIDNSKTITLYIRNIDDADEIYFNGHKIGSTGSMPPSYTTAYDWERKYVIPNRLIRPDSENLIAIRVYDEGMDGGMCWSGMDISFDENEQFLDLNLSGNWKFKLYDNKIWKTPEFDDSNWKNIQVPMTWESQGYYDYNGNAWYRKTFTLPAGLKGKKLYLALGKIDDYDKVFFNGEWIGEVSPSKKKTELKKGFNRGEYDTRRLYEIPEKLIRDGVNLIAIKVYDTGGVGGIYEGPVGLISESRIRAYKNSPDQIYEYEGREYHNFEDFLGDFLDDLFND